MIKGSSSNYCISWFNLFVLVFLVAMLWLSGIYNLYIKWMFN